LPRRLFALMTDGLPEITPDFADSLRKLLLSELTQEVQITKRVIGRIPEGKRDYKPHPGSRSAWELACHITSVDVWFLESLANLDFSVPEQAAQAKTVVELVQCHEDRFAKAATRVKAMSPNQLAAPLDFLHVANLPSVIYLTFAKNHAIHHRGQLSAYLRPMGAKVPDIYGGSADEPTAME
jgi:uncharacterized damage-inducible protein DinB